MIVKGHISVFCSLNKKGVIAGLAITRGGQIKVNAWNSTDAALYLTPKTILVTIVGTSILVKKLGLAEKVEVHQLVLEESMWKKIEKEIKKRFPKVGDLTSHPVNRWMKKLKVRAREVT